jgi:TetR/AcrR family acrAB operon transcriptional repressor
MRRTQDEADITRQNILDAALMVFSKVGYDAARLKDIAEQAGVTRGAIYHHFEGKADLYCILVGEAWDRIEPLIEGAIKEGGSMVDIIKRVFVRKMAYTAKDDVFRAVNELQFFKTGMSPDLVDSVKWKREGFRQGVDGVAEAVRAGIAEGSIRPNIDPIKAGIANIALQTGLTILWMIDPDLFSLAGDAEDFADLFNEGITIPNKD